MAPDKILHLKAGALVLLGCGPLAWLALHFGVHPLALAVGLAGLVAGLAVEGTQWNDNRNAAAAGLPAPHEVSALDALASWVPSLLAAVILQLTV